MFKKLTLLLLAFVLLLNALPAHAAEPITYGLGTLVGMALSPDGTRLAVGTTIGIYFYDAQTFAPQGFWPIPDAAEHRLWRPAHYDLLWSPKSDLLMVANGSSLRVYAVADGALLWEKADDCCGETNWWLECEQAFSPDGTQLLVLDADHQTAEIYDARTGKHQSTYQAADFWAMLQWRHGQLAPRNTQSANGQWAVMGDRVFIYGQTSRVPTVVDLDWGGYSRFTNSRIALSQDGQYLATYTSGGEINIWGLSPLQNLHAIQGHHDGPSNFAALAWSSDNRTLYSAAYNTVVAWDAATGQRLRTLDGFAAEMQQVVWSADGQRLIAAQGEDIGAWDVNTRLPVQRGRQQFGWTTEMVASPTGDLIATYDTGTVGLYDARTLKWQHTLEIGHQVVALAFSADGKWLATGGHSAFINIWDTTTGHPVRDLLGNGRNNFIAALTFSADGQALYALEGNGVLRRWDLTTGLSTTVQTPAPLPNRYYDPVISLTTQRVITERGQGGIDVSDINTGQRLYNVNAPNPTSIILNPQATRFAAIVGNLVKIWALDSGALLAEYPATSGRLTDIAFNPHGQTIASSSSNGIVQVWPVP